MHASHILWPAGQLSPQASCSGWSPGTGTAERSNSGRCASWSTQDSANTARVATEATGRRQLVVDTELAAQFPRELAAAALRFAQRCTELMPDPAVAAPAACGDSGYSKGRGRLGQVIARGYTKADAYAQDRTQVYREHSLSGLFYHSLGFLSQSGLYHSAVTGIGPASRAWESVYRAR